MKVKVGSLKLVPFSQIEPGTLVRSTTDGWSHLFERAIVVKGGNSFEGNGLLPLDGPYTLQVIPRGEDSQTFLVGPCVSYWVDGIDKLDPDTHSNTDGALVITPAGEFMRAKWRQSEHGMPRPCFVDLRSWELAKIGGDVPAEAFGRWQLLCADEDGRNDLVVLESAPVGRL